MKIPSITAIFPAIGISMLSCFSANAATIFQYTFDTHLTGNQAYNNIAGSGFTVNFNRVVTSSDSYPFVSTYPSQVGINHSGRTRYNAATVGTVQNPELINIRTNNQFTIEGWFNLEDFATIGGTKSGGTFFSLGNSSGSTSLFSLSFTDSGLVRASYNSQSQSGGTRTWDTGFTLTQNTWVHLAYVATGTEVKIYVNGVENNSFSEPGITSRVLPTSLGNVSIAGNFYGQFDDIRLSDVALAPADLGYWAPFTPIPEPTTMVLLGGALIAGVLYRKN